jgi:hypothetical protein
MLTTDTITRIQTLTVPTYTLPLPRCRDCGGLLTLHGDCPCQHANRRLLWRGIAYGLLSSVGLFVVLVGLVWWLGRTV